VIVLVDTSVWSLALRRTMATQEQEVAELAELIKEGRTALIGPVRQELLSGVRTESQFRTLKAHLQAFPDVALESADYEEAASFFNRCRARGIQGSSIDFLICAAATRRRMAVFTTDGDFAHYQKVLELQLHACRA
jgi:predicted nucleic acid-binding protein